MWDRHPRPSIRPVEWGPWTGEPAAAEEAMSCPLRTFAGTAPRWPRRRSHEQDERGWKFDSTDQASGLASFSLLSFSPSFLQPLMRLGFHAELVSSELLRGTGGHGAGPGRTRCPGRPPECERPFQDPAGWLGIHLPEGEPKAGPPLTSALPEPSQERTVQNTMGNASVKQSENSENCHASRESPGRTFARGTWLRSAGPGRGSEAERPLLSPRPQHLSVPSQIPSSKAALSGRKSCIQAPEGRPQWEAMDWEM
uniref:Uncharacterized protein n=1 Tax=Myotis myotis TaxID=51298 RepID=A0A7J7XHD2_MYOMY|nr:hypothetical protein mMyoMyo1_011619 [Myotis myotis]